jgi:hypothetical protein
LASFQNEISGFCLRWQVFAYRFLKSASNFACSFALR